MIRVILFFLIPLFFSVPSYAQEAPVHGELLSSYKGVGTFASHDMGLQLSMDDKWYTYWRTPGDAGLAPVMDWSKSENVKNVEVSWPAPKRFTAFDLYSFGYDGSVVLPLKVVPEETGEPVTVRLKLDVVACHEICIPQTLFIEKSLPKAEAVKGEGRELIQAAVAALPVKENNKELGIETAVLGKEAITVIAKAKDGWEGGADLFIETSDMVLTAVPEVVPDEEGNRAVIKVKGPEGIDLTSVLLGKNVVMVLTKGDQSIERPFSF